MDPFHNSFIILYRFKLSFCIKYRDALLKLNANSITIFSMYFLWPPAISDINALAFCLLLHLRTNRHFFCTFQAIHPYFFVQKANCTSCNITASNNNCFAIQLYTMINADVLKKFNPSNHTFGIFALNTW